jgi:beta-lactamase superfamily II metal-dependent hydrolase
MIEIDVLPASTDVKGADSILLRFGNFTYDAVPNNQKVVLIDGGFKDNAQSIKDHLKNFYQTDTIDLMICTHPDQDHISGLIELLDDTKIKVKKALVHDPWKYKYTINRKCKDDRTSATSISNRLDKNLSSLDDLLCKLDERNEILVDNSLFTGHEEFNGIIKILGPSTSYYTQKVTEFPGMPNHIPWSENYNKEIINYSGTMNHFLDEPSTSAKNSSSAIILVNYEGLKILFTGDAGVESLKQAMDYCTTKNIDLSNLSYLQIPHHGSIKNLSEDICNKIKAAAYIVSAPTNSEDHPSKLLLNYFQLFHNKKVFHISNKVTRMCMNAPSRNWSDAQCVPLYNRVQLLTKK